LTPKYTANCDPERFGFDAQHRAPQRGVDLRDVRHGISAFQAGRKIPRKARLRAAEHRGQRLRAPSRLMVSFTSRPGGVSRTILPNCSMPSTRCPLYSSTTSPGLTPAFSAGLFLDARDLHAVVFLELQLLGAIGVDLGQIHSQICAPRTEDAKFTHLAQRRQRRGPEAIPGRNPGPARPPPQREKPAPDQKAFFITSPLHEGSRIYFSRRK
jgi:hypothetical protein